MSYQENGQAGQPSGSRRSPTPELRPPPSMEEALRELDPPKWYPWMGGRPGPYDIDMSSHFRVSTDQDGDKIVEFIPGRNEPSEQSELGDSIRRPVKHGRDDDDLYEAPPRKQGRPRKFLVPQPEHVIAGPSTAPVNQQMPQMANGTQNGFGNPPTMPIQPNVAPAGLLRPSLLDGSKLQGATTISANIALLNIDISAEEYLTFFPLHYRWRQGLRRLIRNGWDQNSIVGYINWSRNLIGRDQAIDCNTLVKQIGSADEEEWGRKWTKATRPRDRAQLNLKPDSWTIANRRVEDVLLRTLVVGVVRFPTGAGEGALTRAVRYAVEHPEEAIMLSGVNNLIRRETVQLLHVPWGQNLDKDALKRHMPIIGAAQWSTPKDWAKRNGLWN
ncbi:hypothetical protein NA57DRAFT_53398 [Rhizodiscina lignyota]|uniref:Uncharacterized protein n=1 Tax=Rhizodiscina lignyota TaxID=1504668 RepID=A0A9P4INM6_9PEZI|nr:hypothetical protein NA57DRAFT_53398 [Rhizodiscina lignyota]